MTIFDKAIIFATNAHSGMFRKGTTTPYIVHPLEAGVIASQTTNDEEIIAAAVLHDVIEDTPTTVEQLESEFSPRIARLVCADSEDKRADRPASETWQIRKQETLDYLQKASYDEQIIVLADKLSNMRSMHNDYLTIGDRLWNKFNVKDKKMHKWYYSGIAKRLSKKIQETTPYKEYQKLILEVFGDD